MRLAAAAMLFAMLAAASPARADAPLKMRVVSWNVWGVPVITPEREARMAQIPAALLALEPDVVCLQELWEVRDAERVAKELGARGLVHSRRFDGPGGRTGLFVASKWPLGDGRFRPFSLGRRPHSLWHLDWLVEKGVAEVTVRTPAGELRLENTHLQAQYRTDEYGAERLAQASELILGGRERSADALLVAGDFNGHGDELPRRVIRDLGELEDASPSSSEDTLYVRGGRDSSLRVLAAKTALGQAFRLESGETLPLSDHAAVVVDLELSRCSNCERSRRVVSATRSAAVQSLERAADGTPFRVILAVLTALSLLVFGVGLARQRGALRRGSRRRAALRLLALGTLWAGFVWCAYLAAFYYPARATELRRIADELGRASAR
ncbi:MAG TPA: endonuclease/exonuclease/phosphatase family protein [Polyangiaceae bacterium]